VCHDLDSQKDSSSLRELNHQVDNSQFNFPMTEYDFDPSAPFRWEMPNDAVPTPARERACRCFESALSITVSVVQGQTISSPGVIDLALEVESQLRETVPLAVHCKSCKGRKGEVLKLFATAMADAVELLRQLCNAEFASTDDITTPDRSMTSSLSHAFDWRPPKPGERLLSSHGQMMSHEPSISGASSHARTTSSDFSGDQSVHAVGRRESSAGIRSPYSSNHLTQSSAIPAQVNSRMALGGESSDGRVTVGRHLIVGDDRKCMMRHLLRRRLGVLSDVLEELIRAMQDLRMGLRRVDSFMSVEELSSRGAEIDTRRALKTAAQLYDIIDSLDYS
jgi:hypothetical protein